jgi:hypothetical protein
MSHLRSQNTVRPYTLFSNFPEHEFNQTACNFFPNILQQKEMTALLNKKITNNEVAYIFLYFKQ